MASRPRARSPFVAVGGLRSRLHRGLEGQQAEGADGDEPHRLHPEGRHHKAAEQRGRTAHSEPDGDKIQRHGFENDEADGGQQPENGVNRHEFSLLFPLIEQNV